MAGKISICGYNGEGNIVNGGLWNKSNTSGMANFIIKKEYVDWIAYGPKGRNTETEALIKAYMKEKNLHEKIPMDEEGNKRVKV